MTLRPTDRSSAPRDDFPHDDWRPSEWRRRWTVDGGASPDPTAGTDVDAAARTAAADRGSDRFVAAVAVAGEVLFAGPSVPAVLGVEREALLGDDLLTHVHPNDRDPVSDALSPVATDRTVTHRLRHASGGSQTATSGSTGSPVSSRTTSGTRCP